MNLAAKDIRHNLGRFVLTAVGIGLLLMIVLGMSGIYRGMIDDALVVVDRIGADLWVVQRGTRGPFAEISRPRPGLARRPGRLGHADRGSIARAGSL
jgi:putative ABC transport system permease protein